MDSSSLCLIEKWFTDHDGDGEFALHERDTPYSVTGPTDTTDRRMLFTTKPQAAMAVMGEQHFDQRFAIVGGYGLPSHDDVSWLGY
jgi:hypothetical protein